MISNNKKLPASSIRDLLKGGLNRDLFRGEKYVASIWVIQLGHDWKKRAGSCSFTDDLDPSISIFKDISLTSEKRSTRIWQDLVRFHQEQRRMMASHWKQQCQSKDRNFSCLNSLVKTLLMCSRSWKLFLPQSWFSRKCVSPRWVWLNIWGGNMFRLQPWLWEMCCFIFPKNEAPTWTPRKFSWLTGPPQGTPGGMVQ